jgi:hypothetical protein
VSTYRTVAVWRVAAELDVSTTQLAVLLCTANHENEEKGLCFPGADTVADKCHLNERVVRRAWRALEEKGLISIDDKIGKSFRFSFTEQVFPKDPKAPVTLPPRTLSTPDPGLSVLLEKEATPDFQYATPDSEYAEVYSESDEPVSNLEEESGREAVVVVVGATPDETGSDSRSDFPTGTGPEVESYVEGEYISAGESETPTDHPVETWKSQPVEPERPAEQISPARKFANVYFGLLDSPPAFKKSGKAWIVLAEQMLTRHELADLIGAAKWALQVNTFWPEPLFRLDRDPLQFFAAKLSKIMPQYQAYEKVQNQKRNKTTESNHDPVSKKSKAAAIHEHNRAAAQEFLLQFGAVNE